MTSTPAPGLPPDFASRAIAAVRDVAAAEILPRFRAAPSRRKADGSPVTEADLAAQKALAEALRVLDPAPFLAEEMPEAEQRGVLARARRYWCVDPVDGTANFSAGHPFFAVSVALVQDGRPAFGVVLDPFADEAFHAVRGGGAWRDATRLEPATAGKPLADCVAEVSLRRAPAALRTALRDHAPYARRLASGSSALSWCHLAEGRIDLFLHGGQMIWDYAAGALVAEEAGASLATLESDDFWSAPAWSRSVIAARTPDLARAWRVWVRTREGAGGAPAA